MCVCGRETASLGITMKLKFHLRVLPAILGCKRPRDNAVLLPNSSFHQ